MIPIAYLVSNSGPITVFHLKGHAVKLHVLTIKFSQKTCFLPKNAFLKLQNIHNFDTYSHPLRNIVLKLFDDKCKAKICEMLTQSY